MAPASTNLLVQPVILLIGAGVLIWLLGYSAIVGVGVSFPHYVQRYTDPTAVGRHGSPSR
jgi:hypothetical protein